VATDAAALVLGDSARPCASAGEVLERSDVVVIATPWREFAHLPVERVAERARKPVVIDCWRLLGDDIEDAVELVRLGTPLETHITR
jgi:UDP-glucose 6-dehydrogenase